MEYFAALSELVSMIHRSIGNLLKWDILELKTWTTKRIIFWHCVLFYSPIPEIFFFRCHCRIHFPTILSFEIKSILTICLSLPHYPVGQGEQTSFLSLSSPLFVFFSTVFHFSYIFLNTFSSSRSRTGWIVYEDISGVVWPTLALFVRENFWRYCTLATNKYRQLGKIMLTLVLNCLLDLSLLWYSYSSLTFNERKPYLS